MEKLLNTKTKEELLEMIETLEYYPAVTNEDDVDYIRAYLIDEACAISPEQILEYYGVTTKFIIIDWANNHCYPEQEFESFEEGWEWIYGNVEEEFEDDGTYDDLYVVDKFEWLPNFHPEPVYKRGE